MEGRIVGEIKRRGSDPIEHSMGERDVRDLLRLWRRRERTDDEESGAEARGDIARRYDAIEEIRVAVWIITKQIHVLNVAGNSEKTTPGIGSFAEQYLGMVFDLLASSITRWTPWPANDGGATS